MVDRSENLKKVADVKYYGWAIYEVQVSKDDTITLPEFDTSQALKKAVLMKDSDGTEVTCTVALNVVTVSGEGTNMDCVLFAYGVRA